jgi:hypothetical protein
MKSRVSRRSTAAIVMAALALVMATIGTGYAAFKLPKNSVGTKQLKKNSVTAAKIKKNAVTSAKVKNHTLTGADINLAKLGTVPSAETANTVPPREGIHLVGAAGEPGFEPGAGNAITEGLPGAKFQVVGFFKDHDDVVHLEGVAEAKGTIPFVFTLPPGYRPAPGTIQVYEPAGEGGVFIGGSNTVISGIDLSGKVLALDEVVSLSGISFRAQS